MVMNSTATKSDVSFLHLPGEIRNHIYRHALTAEPIRALPAFYTEAHSLNLLLTNRQIYKEAASIMYAERRSVAEVSYLGLQLPKLQDHTYPVHHLIIELDWAAPCACQPSLVDEQDYEDMQYNMRKLCAVMRTRLTKLNSIEVIWLVSTPVGDMCHLDEYPDHTKECTKLLRPLGKYLRDNHATMSHMIVKQGDARKTAEQGRARHEKWERDLLQAGNQQEHEMVDMFQWW